MFSVMLIVVSSNAHCLCVQLCSEELVIKYRFLQIPPRITTLSHQFAVPQASGYLKEAVEGEHSDAHQS